MQDRSPELDATVRKSHTAVARADVIQDGKVVSRLDMHSGSVTADRTAAQMRSFELEAVDRDGTLIPEGMTSLLAPFGTRLQLYRGARISSSAVASAQYGAANPWTPQTPAGVMNSVNIDTDGGLVLGP